MNQYLKLTTEIKTAIWYDIRNFIRLIKSFFFRSDADFKLAPFFDGYDRRHLDEHEQELDVCHFHIPSNLYSFILIFSFWKRFVLNKIII
jgi:hypothetical protein